jgi:hypothetical protein
MVTLSLVFSISTMILIIKNNNSMYSKFKFIQTDLDQNYFSITQKLQCQVYIMQQCI